MKREHFGGRLEDLVHDVDWVIFFTFEYLTYME